MPKQIEYPKHLTNNTPATIRRAFDRSKVSITETGEMGYVNITSILTRIIQDTGRFAESWASDVLYITDHLRTLCGHTYPLEKDIDEIFVIGIRKLGVDGEIFLLNRLKDTIRGPIDSYVYPETVYRRILGVRVQVSRNMSGTSYDTPRIMCELADMTNEFIRLDPADLNDNGNLIYPPYKDGNPRPTEKY